jgi:peptide/nickel transport system permease protein
MAAGIAVAAADRARDSLLARVVRTRSGAIGLAIVLLLLLCVVGAPLIAPHDPVALDIPSALTGPSASHPFGTDELGRDVLSRLIYGVRIELRVAIPVTLGALAIGLALGLPAGYFGGFVDNALIVVMDTMRAFPPVVFALAILALLGPSMTNVTVVLALAFAPGYARVARALVLAARQEPYVDAERALGASTWRIVLLHILPNILPPLLTLVAMNLPSAIGAEVGLSFLGLGVQPPSPDWGLMLSDGFNYVSRGQWPIVFTGAALMVTTLGFTFLGEALRDQLDPRLAGALE